MHLVGLLYIKTKRNLTEKNKDNKQKKNAAYEFLILWVFMEEQRYILTIWRTASKESVFN